MKLPLRFPFASNVTPAQTGQWQALLRGSLYLVGINLALQSPFWVAERFYSFQRPLFNYDLVIALLGFCVSIWLGWSLLIGALAIDIIRIASLNYHFLDLADFIESARFAGLLSLKGFVSPGLCLVLAVVSLYGALVVRWLSRWRPQLATGQVLVLLLLGVLDSFNGSMQLLNGGMDRFHIPFNIAGSPTWNIYKMSAVQQAGDAKDALTPMSSTVRDSMWEWHLTHPNRSLMLVLVESMGLPRSAAVRDWLTQQAQPPGIAERWSVRQGEESFRGATTHGELRVLCGLDGRYALIDGGFARRCLPGQLNEEGFESVGYHGFQLSMFNRNRWWQLLGLTPYVFDYWKTSADKKDCHDVFHGVCDTDVLAEAVVHVQDERRFSYVVTLDTHMPLPAAAGAVPADVRALCRRETVTDRACELLNQLGRTLHSLGLQLAAGEGTPFVAVVGDHAPPFLERESRAAFASDKVPFLLLEPRR